MLRNCHLILYVHAGWVRREQTCRNLGKKAKQIKSSSLDKWMQTVKQQREHYTWSDRNMTFCIIFCLPAIEGEHGIGVVQLPPEQGCSPALHEPASGGQVPGHVHLDWWQRRGSAQQDPDPGLRAKEHSGYTVSFFPVVWLLAAFVLKQYIISVVTIFPLFIWLTSGHNKGRICMKIRYFRSETIQTGPYGFNILAVHYYKFRKCWDFCVTAQNSGSCLGDNH